MCFDWCILQECRTFLESRYLIGCICYRLVDFNPSIRFGDSSDVIECCKVFVLCRSLAVDQGPLPSPHRLLHGLARSYQQYIPGQTLDSTEPDPRGRFFAKLEWRYTLERKGSIGPHTRESAHLFQVTFPPHLPQGLAPVKGRSQHCRTCWRRRKDVKTVRCRSDLNIAAENTASSRGVTAERDASLPKQTRTS